MGVAETYDYVIVGAGSAGCVLAGRLTEDPEVRVALLEAGGPDNRPEAHIPFLWPLLLKSNYDWDLLSERARTRPQQPSSLPAARKDARRLQFDQRHDLRARQPC